MLSAPVAIAVPTITPDMIPGSADTSHIQPDKNMAPATADDTVAPAAKPPNLVEAPSQAKGVHLILKGVSVEGAHIFSAKDFEPFYAKYIGQDVELTFAWDLAAEITRLYQNAGYFLSNATVPPQTIADGIIHIHVVEGFIGNVDVDDTYKDNRIIKKYVARILAERPASIRSIESVLLRINDIPGAAFHSVLSPLKGGEEGAINMTLVSGEEKAKGSITFDNNGSRFLGPNEASVSYSFSPIFMQRTTLGGLSTLAPHELKYVNFSHTVALFPDITGTLRGSFVEAHPGFALHELEIASRSTGLGLDLQYQFIRQRQENLSFKLSYDNHNVRSDIFNSPLTRDHVRSVTAMVNYDWADHFNGTTTVSFDIERGIAGLGASEPGELYLSRTKAIPDFTKAQFSISRLQMLTDDWAVLVAAAGQVSSAPLYSSEEFGYGGTQFGRAYDSYELSGDQGIDAMAELRYNGFTDMKPVGIAPYAFYDFGKIWNLDPAQFPRASGSSVGIGTRLFSPWDLSANFTIALPLTREVATPINGSNRSNPRFGVQITQGF